jgi:beta-glucosidase-like glycosyl hydrolase
MAIFYLHRFRVQSAHGSDGGLSKVLMVPVNIYSLELAHLHTSSIGFREGDELILTAHRLGPEIDGDHASTSTQQQLRLPSRRRIG